MEKVTLKNGLRVMLELKPEALSAAVSIYVAAGNRFEDESNSGVSHFIEHMVFKGTTTRSSDDIARESDLMGGQLNAYTTKEYTCFYSRALYEHVPKTLRLICDMLCNPLLSTKDIETEKGVVLEEIGMYEDSPEDLCADMLTAVCYKNKPFGFNILGTREAVLGFKGQDLRSYMEKNYVPERITVSVCGRFDKTEVLEVLEQYFGRLQNTNNPLKYESQKIDGGITLCKRPIEQTQIALCYNGLPTGHPLKNAASIFSSAVGGASSSRINLRVREELGLAYSVYTFTSFYLGTGVFGIAGGMAHKNQMQFLEETQRIVHSAVKDITKEEVELTKEQFKSGLVLSNESMSAIAASAGKQMLLEGQYTDVGQLLEKIKRIGVDEVLEAARLITDCGTVALSVVGSTHSEAFYKKAIKGFN